MRESPRVTIRAFLALDQASNSGVALALLRDGRLTGIRTGQANSYRSRMAMLFHACNMVGAQWDDRPRYDASVLSDLSRKVAVSPGFKAALSTLAVVFEDHTHIPLSAGQKDGKPITRGTAQVMGMGGARDRWQDELDALGHPESVRFWVEPKTWRGVILGPRFARATKEVAKAEAVRWAKARMREQDVDDDEAEALCILTWAGDAIPRQLAAERLQRDLFAGGV